MRTYLRLYYGEPYNTNIKQTLFEAKHEEEAKIVGKLNDVYTIVIYEVTRKMSRVTEQVTRIENKVYG